MLRLDLGFSRKQCLVSCTSAFNILSIDQNQLEKRNTDKTLTAHLDFSSGDRSAGSASRILSRKSTSGLQVQQEAPRPKAQELH